MPGAYYFVPRKREKAEGKREGKGEVERIIIMCSSVSVANLICSFLERQSSVCITLNMIKHFGAGLKVPIYVLSQTR